MNENKTKFKQKIVVFPISNKIKKIRNRTPNTPLTKEEVATLINHTTDLETKTLFILGFNTGMRVSEITNISWLAVNWNENTITIWDEKKNKYRNVIVDSYTMSALRLWHNTNNFKQEKIFSFTTKTVQNKLKKWTEKILNKKKSWHCVRHTYITLNVIENTPLTIISDNTGDSPATIYKYYTQIPYQKKKEIIEKNKIYSG